MRALGWLFVSLTATGPGCVGDPAPPAPVREHEFPVDPDAVILAGTGAMTPLAFELASAWQQRQSRPRLLVEASIGTGGGIRATVDGAIDLGLISRPLSESERRLGLIEFPVARDAVVLAANRHLRISNLTARELLALFTGNATHFADDSPATVFLRDRQDSANPAMERALPGFAAACKQAAQEHRFRVIYHDDAMSAALASTPGGIGLLNLGSIVSGRLPLKVLSIDDRSPTLAAVRDGGWPAVRDLAFVVRPDRVDRVRFLLDFAVSPAGQQIIRDGGYAPLAEVSGP